MGDIPNNPLSKSLALVYFESEVFIRTPSVHRGVGKGKESGGGGSRDFKHLVCGFVSSRRKY